MAVSQYIFLLSSATAPGQIKEGAGALFTVKCNYDLRNWFYRIWQIQYHVIRAISF